MSFNFANPWMLLIIPVIVLFIVFASKRMRIIPKWRKRTILSLKLLVLILVVLCLSGLGIKMVSNKATSIFLVDNSESNSRNKTMLEDIIKTAIKSKSKSDSVGIVTFGNDSALEQAPAQNVDFSSIHTKIDSTFTNIEQAMKFATPLFPASDRKRIVVLSDGIENVGDAIKQARLLKQKNISIDVIPFTSREINEVQIKEIKLPKVMKLKDRFDISVYMESTVKTKGVLRLYADRTIISEKNIDIKKGENYFSFSQTADKGGIVTYSAEIDPVSDTITKNNKLSDFSYVEDTAKLLVIQDEDGQSSELIKILGKNVDIKVIKPENAPTTVSELQKYDAYILSNVSSEKLDDKFMTSLETCIKYQGKGLLVTGGENSYAPGGYLKTPLEKVLPVNMEIKPKEETPNLGLVLVIDKSGSMSEAQYDITKIELAKEAAIRSTEALKKNDMIGVIGFDSETSWVVKMQNLNNTKSIQDAIGSIRADGGTQIISPLEEAYEALKNTDTKLKHIILLTDGQAEKTGFDEVLNNMNKAGITLSTVAVGYSADKKILASLAQQGKGRYYETDEFSDIPKIFTKETMLASKTFLNNRSFTPALNSYSEILKGITTMPELSGYVGTTAKSAAKVVLTSDIGDPVLAEWQYGMGKTVAWTSDAAGIWTGSFMKWDKAPLFWGNLISYIIGKKTLNDFTVKTTLESGKAKIELKLSPADTSRGDKADAVLIGPSGKEQNISLNATSPGSFEGSMTDYETGTYIANITIKKGQENVKSISTGIIMPYSPELDIAKGNSAEFLQKLVYEGGGHIINNTGDIFKDKLPPVVSILDMTNLMLVLAVIFFMLDILLRRLNFDMKKIKTVIITTTNKGFRYSVLFIKPVSERLLKNLHFSKKKTHLKQNIEPLKSTNDYLSQLLEKKKNKK